MHTARSPVLLDGEGVDEAHAGIVDPCSDHCLVYEQSRLRPRHKAGRG